jgi:ABC-2 type transport system permease protein
MRHWLRVTGVLLSSQYALMLEYRAEIVLWALSGVLPLIMLGVWSGAGAAADLGLSPQQLGRYFIAAFVVRQFTVVWVIHVFEEDNLQGRLSPYLLQPLQPLWRYLCSHLAEQATRLPIVAGILALLMLLQPGGFAPPSAGALLLGVLAIQLAFLVRFLLQSLITMLCFWSERAAALDRLLMIPYLFLSGLVAPIESFPEGVRTFALATPFPWLMAFPAGLLAGMEGPGAAGGGFGPVATGFMVLLGWGALLLPLTLLFWRLGVRRYSAMGA